MDWSTKNLVRISHFVSGRLTVYFPTTMVSPCGVWIDSHHGGIDVNDGIRQVWDVMEKLVVGDLGNLMRFHDG